MKYLKIADMEISALSLGTWEMGGGTAWSGTDDDISVEMIHRARELGINQIDTAPVYGTGHSEEVVGRALKGRRGDYILSTKCSMQWREQSGVKMYERDGKSVYKYFSAQSLRTDLEESLRRLSTDYIDIYITHRQPDELSQIPEVYGTLSRFMDEGKIRAIGISNASPHQLSEHLKCGPVALVQEKFSILESGHIKEYIPLCEKNGIVFQAYSVLERGLLAGTIGMDYTMRDGEGRGGIKWFAPDERARVLAMLDGWRELCGKYRCSMANLVIAFTLSRSPSMCVLFGARRMESLLDTAKTPDVSLSPEDIERMERDAALLTATA